MATKRPRSADTKKRIVQSARRLFSEEGYEKTTIRAVASDANIDPSMVMRYFVSKEGLFAAATTFDLRLPDLKNLPRENVGKELVRHFLAMWGREDDGLVMLLRTACSNEDARERMRQIFASQVVPMVKTIAPSRDEAILRAELIGSQLLGLAFCRFVLGLPTLGGDDTEAIVERVGPVIQMHLLGKPNGGGR